jgi:hypothetical protein
MEQFIHRSHYSPSELREAAMLACIHFKMQRVSPAITLPPAITIEEALDHFVKKDKP